MFNWLKIHFKNTMRSERGGGSKPTFYSAPTTPAPSAGETAGDLYQARLQYDPQVAALEYALAQQYAPQYGALATQVAQQQFPGLEQLRATGTARAQEQLESPFAYTAEEEAALGAGRERARQQTSRAARERANLGGGLYGGRAELSENRMRTELEQAFTQEDMNRRLQAGQIAQQSAIPYMQILYPQVQNQPAVSNQVTPGANALYNAYFQASQPNQAFQQGQPSPLWGLAGSALGAAGMAASGGLSAGGIWNR